MVQTSTTILIVFKTFIGKLSLRKIIKECPAPMFNKLFLAKSISSSLFPVKRINLGPEASAKATPKRMNGEEEISAS